jgi:hypothetical protein
LSRRGIIDFEGIKFTSKSFQFEINARQMLVINERPIFKACLIKHKKQEHSQDGKCHDDAAAAEAEADAQAASSTTDNVSVATNAPDVSGSAKVIENASETPSSPLKQHLETLEISSSSSSSSKEVEAEADVVAVVPELVPLDVTSVTTTIVEESSKDATKPRHLEEEKEIKEEKEVKEKSSTTKNNDSNVNENKSDTTESNSNKNCELNVIWYISF